MSDYSARLKGSGPSRAAPAGASANSGSTVAGGKVDAILARFPGPVTLNVSRVKYTAVLLGSLALLAGLLSMLQHGAISPANTMKAWFGVALFGAGVFVAVVMLLPGAGSLTLSADGFERVTLFMRFPTPWQQAGNFGVSELRTRRSRRMRLVGYDDAKLAGGNFSQRKTGRNSALPDTYGLSPEDLALLMNQWRARALKRLGSGRSPA